MKKVLLLACMFSLGTVAMAQQGEQDPKAQKILDELSAKNKAYTSISVEFKQKTVNKDQGLNESATGKATVNGDRYFVKSDQDMYCNGKTHWTYLESANEVYINDAEEISEENPMMNPKNIFTIWETGFKFRYIESKGGKDIIDLFPKNPDGAKFHTVQLKVDQAKKQISSMTIRGKDNTNITYDILSFTPNVAVSDSKFMFDYAKHPGVKKIDQR
jgi:outer membrane lipoprotein carrier protein